MTLAPLAAVVVPRHPPPAYPPRKALSRAVTLRWPLAASSTPVLPALFRFFASTHPSPPFMRLAHTALLLPLVLLLVAWSAPVDRAQPATASAATDTLRFDLNAAILQSLEASPEVGIVASDRDRAEARSSLARASRFGTVFNAQTAHAIAPGIDNPNNTGTDTLYLDPDVRNDWTDIRPFNQVEVELLQPIYTWGELGGNVRAARHGVDVEAARVRGEEVQVAFRTAELYYAILLTNELARVADEAEDVLRQARTEVERLLDEGDPDVDSADEYKLALSEQELKRQRAEVQQQQQTLRSAFARQLGLPGPGAVLPDQEFLEALAFVPQDMDTYAADAIDARPELRQARAGREARQEQVTVARSDYFPKLFAGVQANYRFAQGRFRQPNPFVSDSFDGRSLRAGLGLQFNVNIFQTRARVEQARADARKVDFQLEAAEQLTLFEVEEAYRSLQSATVALEAEEEALAISRRWLREEQINFDLDFGDTSNLIEAVETNLEQRIRYNEAVRSYNMAILRLHRASGTLVDRTRSGTLVD